jgi:hypothetical protein
MVSNGHGELALSISNKYELEFTTPIAAIQGHVSGMTNGGLLSIVYYQWVVIN